MKTEKICIYTCITGDYDNLHDVEKDEDIDYICFTNNHTLKSDRWQFVYIQDEENIGDMLLSRKIKILGHPLLEKYDISIWVDGALQVKKDIRKLLTTFCDLENYSMACFRHRLRNCVYQEATACVIHRKANREEIIQYLDFIKKEQFPEDYGLAECTVLIRRENQQDVKDTMHLWYDLLCKYVKRDQLSFPYSIWKTGLKICWIDLNVFDNPWFFWYAHKQKTEKKTARIFFGNYQDVYTDVYVEKKMELDGNICKIKFVFPRDYSKISINIGQHFGKVITSLKTSIPVKRISAFPGISHSGYTVFDYDDMVLYFEGKFQKNQKFEVSFDIRKFGETKIQEVLEGIVSEYYYDKIIRDNMINGLNKRCTELEGQIIYLHKEQENSLIRRAKKLCDQQDIKSKILKKLIMKCVKLN